MSYNGLQVLSDLVVFSKYAQYRPDLLTRETWDQIVDRRCAMDVERFPEYEKEIRALYDDYVRPKKVLASMRSFQFAGKAIDMNEARGFNCFRRDTEFVTSEGIKSFRDYKDGDKIEVLADRGFVPATVKCFGKAKLYRLKIRKGSRRLKEIYTTDNHRWLVTSKTHTEEKTTLELLPGMALKYAFNSRNPQLKPCTVGIQHGFVFGDGTKDVKGRTCIRLCGDSKELLKFFNTGSVVNAGVRGGDPQHLKVTGLPWHWKELPPLSANREYLLGFLMGYFAADGSIGKTGSNISLYCKDPDVLQWCRGALAQLSIFTADIKLMRETSPFDGTIKPLYILTLNTGDMFEEFFLKSKHKERFKGLDSRDGWIVDTVEETDVEEDVWCVHVPEKEMFTLACGVTTKNCSYQAAQTPRLFRETMFLLLSGTGCGYSVQKHHVAQLPPVQGCKEGRPYRFVIEDSLMGWAGAVDALVKAYFEGRLKPRFVFDEIREKGARLVTSGGKAPGPEPLRVCLEKLEAILEKAKGRQLRPIEVHDMQCHIANSVLAGGIRRAALICLFSPDDEEMLTCKHGEWWVENEQRGRANNSAMFLRTETTYEQFKAFMKYVKDSGCGEPGWMWVDDLEYGGNPCLEILFTYSPGFCNLTEVNCDGLTSQEEFNARCRAGAMLGTLQATYTDFHYLDPEWRDSAEKEALLGVSLTGQAHKSFYDLNLREGANHVVLENEKWAKKLGIRTAARATCTKPSGTASCVLGTSSGVHRWHDLCYIRRIRVGKNEALYQYMARVNPRFVEDDVFRPETQAVISIPIKAPDDAITRVEDLDSFLAHVKMVNEEWVHPGRRRGIGNHNVSATASIREHEWDTLLEWAWKNRFSYTGLSVLPYDGGTYVQAPFETITPEAYEDLVKLWNPIDVTEIVEYESHTDFVGEAACSGGSCEVV